jgi:hypothetical protein
MDLEPPQPAFIRGYWRVRVRRTGSDPEYIRPEYAMKAAAEFDVQGFSSLATQFRTVAAAVLRFETYTGTADRIQPTRPHPAA